MIYVEDYTDKREFRFDKLIIDTDKKHITVQLNEFNILCMIEVYSAIKQMWVKGDMMKWHFPMRSIDHMTVEMLHGYHLTTS